MLANPQMCAGNFWKQHAQKMSDHEHTNVSASMYCDAGLDQSATVQLRLCLQHMNSRWLYKGSNMIHTSWKYHLLCIHWNSIGAHMHKGCETHACYMSVPGIAF